MVQWGGVYEHGVESLASIRGVGLLGELRNYQLIKENCNLWSWFGLNTFNFTACHPPVFFFYTKQCVLLYRVGGK